MRTLNIISYTRGTAYTASEAVNKLLERRNFKVNKLEILPMPCVETYASDWDGVIKFDIETLESLWTNSVLCHIKGEIPFHMTDAGRLELGLWECAEVPGWELPDYRKPEVQKEKNFPHVEIHAEGMDKDGKDREDFVSFLWDYYSKDEEQREIQRTLVKTVRRAILQRVLCVSIPYR